MYYIMVRRISALLLLLVMAAGGCSERRTRQFVPAEAQSASLQAGSWVISMPRVVAFKDVIDIKDISDTTMFWISMRAARLKGDASDPAADIRIDSLKVSFLPDGGEYWRKPTRSVAYGDPDEKYLRKAFDFFGDQGIVIPAGIDSILVEFSVLGMDDRGASVVSYPFEIRMVRDETALKVPLLQQ